MLGIVGKNHLKKQSLHKPVDEWGFLFSVCLFFFQWALMQRHYRWGGEYFFQRVQCVCTAGWKQSDSPMLQLQSSSTPEPACMSLFRRMSEARVLKSGQSCWLIKFYVTVCKCCMETAADHHSPICSLQPHHWTLVSTWRKRRQANVKVTIFIHSCLHNACGHNRKHLY